jgi:hypothetical protein
MVEGLIFIFLRILENLIYSVHQDDNIDGLFLLMKELKKEIK